jgi:hypothetical protein
MGEAYELAPEENSPGPSPVGGVFPQSHQEIARARHADLLREATQDRLGRIAQGDDVPAEPAHGHTTALRWAAAVVGRAVSSRPAVHPA